MMAFIKKNAPLILLVILAGILRFSNLGYSEFQDDEKKALFRVSESTSSYEFLMNQRKGPMQFLVTGATGFIINDDLNEFAIRLPFTIANLLSVVVFYLILKNLFKSQIPAFLGALIFSLNGFSVGFSRIAQYQNLNILFSLLSFYFFLKLSQTNTKHLKFSLLGTLFFSLSLLSHWDAIFFTPPIIFFYISFILNKSISKHEKIRTTLINLALGCILLLPFLIPYILKQLSNPENVRYFNRRVGLSTYTWDRHKFIFELYNPFVAIYFLPFLALIGLFWKRKGLLLLGWSLINLITIKFFMQKPGTHIYNYVIPLIFLASAGIQALYTNRIVFKVLLLPLFISISFLYYQSFMIFVDNKQEYPWDEKEILKIGKVSLTTEEYTDKEILTFGFPHFRNWRDVDRVVSQDSDNCSYISNEGKEITEIYMSSKYGILEKRSCYYIVDVKNPFNTRAKGAVYAETVGKKPVYTFKMDGKSLVKVYKITTDK